MMYTTYRTRPARPEMMMNRMLRNACAMPDRAYVGFPVDVEQTESGYVLTAELPGVKLSDIEITLEEDLLTIAVRMQEGGDKEHYVLRERPLRPATVERTFTIEGIDRSAITAACADGVLTVTLPREAPAAGREKRRIAINGASAQPEVAKLSAPTEE